MSKLGLCAVAAALAIYLGWLGFHGYNLHQRRILDELDRAAARR